MKAYHYNELKFFDKEFPCQIDKLETKTQGKTIYLTPKDSTLTKPTIKDGYTPRWNGDAWKQYADNKIVYGYTDNDDGTINYYGFAHTEEELTAKNAGVDLLFTDTKPVSVNGVYWLSADDPAYIEAKAQEEKDKALSDLDAQFRIDRATVMEYYTQSVFDGDTETQEELKAEMEEIKETYAEERKKIEEE